MKASNGKRRAKKAQSAGINGGGGKVRNLTPLQLFLMSSKGKGPLVRKPKVSVKS